MPMTKRQTIKALLVEDSPADIAFTTRSFKGTRFQFLHALDGAEGLLMARTHQPDIIFLDINMPRIRGDEVLRALKADPETRGIPVIMLTHSQNPDHITSCWDLQCAAYIAKPVTLAGFIEVAKKMDYWWADLVRLPDKRIA